MQIPEASFTERRTQIPELSRKLMSREGLNLFYKKILMQRLMQKRKPRLMQKLKLNLRLKLMLRQRLKLNPKLMRVLRLRQRLMLRQILRLMSQERRMLGI